MQTAEGFERERDELNLAYPNTEVGRRAVAEYLETLERYNRTIAELLAAGRDIPDGLADAAPAFPEPYYNQWVSRTETPTHTYNFCLSPLTPFAIRGLGWIPGEDNVSDDVSRYARSLEVFARSLPATFGQERVSFFWAQPADSLVEGIEAPRIPGAPSVEFDAWPKTLESLVTRLGERVASTEH